MVGSKVVGKLPPAGTYVRQRRQVLLLFVIVIVRQPPFLLVPFVGVQQLLSPHIVSVPELLVIPPSNVIVLITTCKISAELSYNLSGAGRNLRIRVATLAG